MLYPLKRKEILRKSNDLKKLFSDGSKITGKYVIIYFHRSDRKKVAFIVSKKIDKRAVIRNRIKRWLREIYRQGKYKIVNNVEILMVARHNILNVDYTLLKDEVEKLFKNINYITD